MTINPIKSYKFNNYFFTHSCHVLVSYVMLFFILFVTVSCNKHSNDNINMVFVEGGSFVMGATSEQDDEFWSNELPTHKVQLNSFYISKYEITQKQWQAVMGKNPSWFINGNLPVENVSWNDVHVFLNKLNAMTGKNYRLPTEAEWEFAARGGNHSRGYKFSGDNFLNDVAWYDNNSGAKTHPVGKKLANELGIFDMSGNVSEWCEDRYGSYSQESQFNPTGPKEGYYRVVRGGSFSDYSRRCRVSNHFLDDPDASNIYTGFRIVCPADSDADGDLD